MAPPATLTGGRANAQVPSVCGGSIGKVGGGFLCGTRKIKEYQTSETKETSTVSKETKLISKINRNLSSRAFSMVKMVSWRKVKPEADDEEEDYGDPDEQILWRKNILMGERCRPIDFSEKILYDSEGNVLPDLSHQNNKQYQVSTQVCLQL
ncbi:hypothetical protein TanjilG_18853 [Lupinus angustifolius]|uniref:Uncharacterized protein n=1 Tax=Lupinus angustifolius TaxID=3871 RepID=A0A4P1RQF9_LUPAN|nr:hypothetical protein TanjilG_18853 [Lupinus angustifolius]